MSTLPTATQHAILLHAVQDHEGHVQWFPASLKGAAREKALASLIQRGWVSARKRNPLVTHAGYAAIGMTPPGVTSKPAPARANSKQAQMLSLLRRPEGATIADICTVTGWQAHTVRGAFAGTLKKRLGLTITSQKSNGEARVYRAL